MQHSPVKLLSIALPLLIALVAGCSPPGGTPGGPGDAGPEDASDIPVDVGDIGPDAAAPDTGRSDADAATPDAGGEGVFIDAIRPNRSGLTGGSLVTLDGSGFFKGFATGPTAARLATDLRFGVNAATDFTIIDDTRIEVVAPSNAASAVDVTIENPNGRFVCVSCFTYFAPLTLSTVSPVQGPVSGGIEVTLTGSGFAAGLSVQIGAALSPRVTVVSDTEARAFVPPGEPGAIDVRVFAAGGSDVRVRAFTYVIESSLDAVSPAWGPTTGGTVVTLTGAGLSPLNAIRIGGAIAVVTSAAFDQVVARTPSHAAGPVDVVVYTPTELLTRQRAFFYVDPAATAFVVHGIVPDHGPAAGGEARIVGSGLDGATVTVSGVAATPISADGFGLRVAMPGGAAGEWVDVVVEKGSDRATLTRGYRYRLALQALSESRGPCTGGESVTLTGAGFPPMVEVLFGATPASGVVVENPSRITLSVPPGLEGTVDVTVRDPSDSENRETLPGAYTYEAPLWIGRIVPDSGAISGGTLVTVLGTGFGANPHILLGGAPLRDVQRVDANQIKGRTPPASAPAMVSVSVRAEGGEAELPSAFTYFDPKILGGGSSGGPIAGSLNVTVLQSGMNNAPVVGATVLIGPDLATPLQGRTDWRGQITLSDPALNRAVDVTISKDSFQTQTIFGQNSQNLTVYLVATVGTSLGSVDPPPELPPTLGGGTTGSETNTVYLSGQVTGFKLPRSLEADEEEYAEVWLAPLSIYESAPLGWTMSPDYRDSLGELWQVRQDGGLFTVVGRAGNQAIYAIYGIRNTQTEAFTPLLMGVRRDVIGDPAQPAIGQNIALTMHLDQHVPITILSPLTVPGSSALAPNSTYAWLILGTQGTIPIATATASSGSLTLSGMPRLDGDSFLFFNQVRVGSQTSNMFRKQLGDLSVGVTIGPMLDPPSIVHPSGYENFAGEVELSPVTGVAPDVMQIEVYLWSSYVYRSIWRAVLPGDVRRIVFPDPVLQTLALIGKEGDAIYVAVTASRTSRFDYAYWNYGQLSSDSWSGWTSVNSMFNYHPPEAP